MSSTEISPETVNPLKRKATLGFLSLLDEGLISAANFFTGLLLGRSCKAEEFGAYSLGFSSLNAVNTVQAALVTNPLSVFAPAKEGETLHRYLGGVTALQLCLSATIAVLGLTTAAVLIGTGAALPWTGTLLGVSIAAFFEQIQEFTRRVLLGRFRVGAAVVNDLVCSALRMTSLLALLGLSSTRGNESYMTSRNAFLCVASAAAIASLLGFFQIRSLLAHPFRELRAAWNENWSFGRWGLAQSFATALTSQIYPWVLARTHGAAEVGALGACSTLVFIVNPIHNGLGSFFGPLASRAFSSGGVASIKSVTKQYALVSCCLVGSVLGAVVLIREPALHLIYNGKYDGRGLLVAMLAISGVLYSLSRPLANALNGMRRPDLLFRTQIISIVVTSALAWPLLKRFGAVGVAYGSILGSLILLTVRGTVLSAAARESSKPPGSATK